MRPSTRRTLEHVAALMRQNRLTEALRVAEPLILFADVEETGHILRWITDHAEDLPSSERRGP